MGVCRQDLTVRHWERIRRADIIMGGRRHLALFDDLDMPKHEIASPIEAAVDFMRQNMTDQRIVVLASGDPLFFGIGALLISRLGSEHVEIDTNVSSVAVAFARIKEPCSRARVISLHGRGSLSDVLHAMGSGQPDQSNQPVAVLTDPRHSPAWLAGELQARGIDQVAMAVCERLGAADEKVAWYTPEQAAAEVFKEPNVVVFKPMAAGTPVRTPLHMGMAEDAFAHESSLITKSEVRAVSLAKLRLRPGLTLWDLGAGSGAVGIEAALMLGGGRIVAVEQKAERAACIRQNARRFGVYNLDVVEAVLPAGIEVLPPPDRVFIGGGGCALPQIIQAACRKLTPQGVIVINTVLLDNLHAALETLRHIGLEIDIVQVQVSRAKPMPWSLRLDAVNPVWIISANRTEP